MSEKLGLAYRSLSICEDKCESLQAELDAFKSSIEDHNVAVQKLKDSVVSLGMVLQACLNLHVKGQPCMITDECADGVYWQDAIMDCIEKNTGMKYDREVVYLSQLPESQYIKALKKLEKDRAAKGELS